MSIAGIINEKFIEPRINRIREGFREDLIAEIHAEMRDEVRAEVRDRVRAEGRAEANAKWREWLARNAPELAAPVNQDDPPPYTTE